ncbi:MAG: hypothetical protein AAGG68_15930 [Bacteroidota bacterium]
MKTYIAFTITFCLLALACQDKEDTLISNKNSLFPNTLPLNIEVGNDEFNLPIFNIESIEPTIFSIVVSKKVLIVNNQQIQNPDDIVWQWNSGMENTKEVRVTQGALTDATDTTLSNILCNFLTHTELYWAAWAWDSEGIEVTHSTQIQPLVLGQSQQTNFTIDKISINDTDGDGYLKAGEQITYKITLDYQENFPLNGLIATLNSANIVELPITIQVDSTIIDKVDLSYTFTLPTDAVFKEEIPLRLNLAFNDCFSQQLDLSVATTGRDVCLVSMTLKKIYTNPPNGEEYWDPTFPCGLGTFNNPDPCYTLTSESIPNIYSNCPSENSGELEDVDPRCPNAQWPALSPCSPLALNEFHTVRVLDENAPWCEDNEFIGQIGFYPRDFLDSTPTFQIVTSETIQIELELAWE